MRQAEPAIVGVHLEGPFINPSPKKRNIIAPSIDLVKVERQVTNNAFDYVQAI